MQYYRAYAINYKSHTMFKQSRTTSLVRPITAIVQNTLQFSGHFALNNGPKNQILWITYLVGGSITRLP